MTADFKPVDWTELDEQYMKITEQLKVLILSHVGLPPDYLRVVHCTVAEEMPRRKAIAEWEKRFRHFCD